MKILILCTGNSCRSQMAEGFLKSFDHEMEVYSAGTHPAEHVHPVAVKVMGEIGIDLSSYLPKRVDGFLNDAFDYVITVCDNARENCPVFTGKLKQEEILSAFRTIRDEIRENMYEFYLERIKK
jgi:arsenate reductase